LTLNMKKNVSKSRQRPSQPKMAEDNIPRLVGPSGALPLGFPNKLLSRVRYHDTATLVSAAGSIAKQVYRLNSTFDPDSTGIGHQPMFRDTFAAIYDHYSVVSTKFRVKFVNTSNVSYHVGALIDDDGATSTTVDTLCEDTNGRTVMLPPVTGSLSSTTIDVSWDAKKFLGIDPFTSETYKTAVGSNPAEESDMTIWATPTDGISSPTILADVMIEYTVLWTELTSPTQS